MLECMKNSDALVLAARQQADEFYAHCLRRQSEWQSEYSLQGTTFYPCTQTSRLQVTHTELRSFEHQREPELLGSGVTDLYSHDAHRPMTGPDIIIDLLNEQLPKRDASKAGTSRCQHFFRRGECVVCRSRVRVQRVLRTI